MLASAQAAVTGGDGAAWLSALVALAVAVFGCIGWGCRRAWHVARRVSRFSDDWFGQEARDGLPARPGVMARLGSVEQLLGQVHAETQADHGTSLRDVVNRMADDLTEVKTEQAAVRAELTRKETP